VLTPSGFSIMRDLGMSSRSADPGLRDKVKPQATVWAAMSSITAAASLRTLFAVSEASLEPMLAILPASFEYSEIAF
jgi:hypothetical protein